MDERNGSAPFVVMPEFRVKPDAMAAFLEAAADDARHSVADEPGCRQFDVVRPENTEEAVVFYEVYDDRAAFEVHLRTAHLKRLQAAMKRLDVQETQVRFAKRAHP